MPARMSGFSTMASVGGPSPATFLILSPAVSAVRQSATAATKIAASAGSSASTASLHLARRLDMGGVHAGRIGDRHRARDEADIGAEPCQRGRDGVALAAGGAVGDVAHRVDRLMRRPGGDDDLSARQRPGRAGRAGARWRRRSPAARPCGPRPPRRSRPSRRDWGRRRRCRRLSSVARLRRVAGCAHIAGFMAGAISTGFVRGNAARSRRGRWQGRWRAWPSGRRSPAPPRRDRPRATGGYGRHHARRRGRRGR